MFVCKEEASNFFVFFLLFLFHTYICVVLSFHNSFDHASIFNGYFFKRSFVTKTIKAFPNYNNFYNSCQIKHDSHINRFCLLNKFILVINQSRCLSLDYLTNDSVLTLLLMILNQSIVSLYYSLSLLLLTPSLFLRLLFFKNAT